MYSMEWIFWISRFSATLAYCSVLQAIYSSSEKDELNNIINTNKCVHSLLVLYMSKNCHQNMHYYIMYHC